MSRKLKIEEIGGYSDLSKLRTGYPTEIIGLCHGCFDDLHEGHITHLEAAKKEVDILIVSITSDKYVNKGEGRPLNDEHARLIALLNIDDVDGVFINHDSNALPVIRALHPDFYIKGEDYQKSDDYMLEQEKIETERYGGRIFFTETGEMSKIHTTDLIQKNNITKEYIDVITKTLKNPTTELFISRLVDCMESASPASSSNPTTFHILGNGGH